MVVHAEVTLLEVSAKVKFLFVTEELRRLFQVLYHVSHHLACRQQRLLRVVGHGAVRHALGIPHTLVSRIVHRAPSAQQVKVQQRTQGKSLAAYHTAFYRVNKHNLAVEIPPLEQVVGIGDCVVLCTPHIGKHTLGVVGTACLAVIDVHALAVIGTVGELVIHLRKLLSETEAEVLSIGILLGHGYIKACKSAHVTVLGGEELFRREVGVGSDIQPVVARSEGEDACQPGNKYINGLFHNSFSNYIDVDPKL